MRQDSSRLHLPPSVDSADAEIRRLRLTPTIRCPRCKGAGDACPRCCGLGQVRVGCSLRRYIAGCQCVRCRDSDAELGVLDLRRIVSGG